MDTEDLVQRLQQAACDSLEAERAGLTYDTGRLRTVTVELELANGGAVIGGNVYIHRTRRTLSRAGRRPLQPGLEVKG